MTTNDYLLDKISKYKSEDLSNHQLEIKTLHRILKCWANTCYLNIAISGSIAKGTAISLASDVDYFVSLAHDCNATLKKIYNSLYVCLNKHYYPARKQNVSIGITIDSLKIDVCAGTKRPGNTNCHSIYVSNTDGWIQTNIQQHINQISNSGRQDVIKLIKIWRELNNLKFPSIYLEYLVIDILKQNRHNDLPVNFMHVLNTLSTRQNNPLDSSLIDPANSNNVLSDLINHSAKNAIKYQASCAVQNSGNLQKIVY